MENVIFNELVRRGYSVDVGMVTTNPTINGVRTRVTSEIDFVINKASERIYVQSAFSIPDAEKRAQETCSLRNVRDSFRKVVITGDAYETPWMDQNGILFIGFKAFLLDPPLARNAVARPARAPAMSPASSRTGPRESRTFWRRAVTRWRTTS